MTEQPESPDLSGTAPTTPPPRGPQAGPPSYPYAYPPAPPAGPGYPPYQGAYPGAYPPPPMPYGDPYLGAPAPKRNGLGTAALVMGILAVFPGTCTVIFGIVLGIVAVILGFLARGRVTRGEADNAIGRVVPAATAGHQRRQPHHPARHHPSASPHVVLLRPHWPERC